MKRALLVLMLLASTAHADVTVGLFAPSAPFPSTAARVELASRLGEAIGKATGTKGNGKVFARAADFAAAVKKGEITFAVVDAAYLAATGGNYTVLAVAMRGGAILHGWQLVSRGGAKLGALRGKRVLVPGIGGRETDFVLGVLFGGEVARDYFGKIEPAPDTASALAALALGKADAAVVPAGVDPPSGTQSVLPLGTVSGPLLVAFSGATAAQREKAHVAVVTFEGDATISAFLTPDPEAVRSVARRFTVVAKRGPFAIPAVRLLVGDLVEGRTIEIERTPVTSFAVAPAPR